MKYVIVAIDGIRPNLTTGAGDVPAVLLKSCKVALTDTLKLPPRVPLKAKGLFQVI